MSFLYPRTITITRPGAQPDDQVGDQGVAPSSARALESVIAQGIPANIQYKSGGAKDATGLPAGTSIASWRVLTPRGALSDGLVQDRDYITDDLQRRFQVIADYTNSLGANFGVQRIEA